jgi:putative transposase
MDWFSRHVLAWRLSNTLESTFCLEALDEALAHSQPEIFNTDQGSQFISEASRRGSSGTASRSAWMARGVQPTTCSSSDCGEA